MSCGVQEVDVVDVVDHHHPGHGEQTQVLN